jgi:hypothetical protein
MKTTLRIFLVLLLFVCVVPISTAEAAWNFSTHSTGKYVSPDPFPNGNYGNSAQFYYYVNWMSYDPNAPIRTTVLLLEGDLLEKATLHPPALKPRLNSVSAKHRPGTAPSVSELI